jgi:hypothetical protein
MARKFSLINGANQIFDLNDLNSFGYEPSGLGVSISNTYFAYGTDFIEDNQGLNQNVIHLNVLFGAKSQESYRKYNDFIRFLNVTPLTLRYSLDGLGTYSRLVKLSELTKTEINKWNAIDEELTLECIGAWYQWIEGGTNIYVDQPGDGKIYVNTDMANNKGHYVYAPASLEGTTFETPFLGFIKIKKFTGYRYDYNYVIDHGYTENFQTTRKILYDPNDARIKKELVGYVYEEDLIRPRNFFVINNDSIYLGVSDGAPFEITITATDEMISNPEWHLLDGVNELQSDRYFIDIPPHYSLVVSSDPHNQRVELVSNTGIINNVYQTQDMTKTNFIKIPPGRYSLVLLGEDTSNVKWRMKKEWVVI